MSNKPTALVILDGFGYREQQTYNAIAQANTPFMDYLFGHYPHTLLRASGTAVGLPPHSIGNSEVGHLTIGAGRIIKQPVVQMNEMIEHNLLFKDTISKYIFNNTKHNNGAIHLLGLLSDANVHSNDNHLYAMLYSLKKEGFSNIIVHPFLDGRDTPPRSAEQYLTKLDAVIKKLGVGVIGSLHGRFYAMDRDHNWERTEQSYNVLTAEQVIKFSSWQNALTFYYNAGIFDEFIPPTSLHHDAIIHNQDTLIFFNFRSDRMRQLVASFVAPVWTGLFSRKTLSLTGCITAVEYDTPEKLPTHALLKPIHIKNTLKQVLNEHTISMLSIAETEKYAHVTYFFNGGNEQPLSHEERVLIPSISVKNYIQRPEMSAGSITDAVLSSLSNNPKDFYLINYANADMVGHSGNIESTVKAIECLDHQLERLYQQIAATMHGTIYITGDHGNAEYMFNPEENQPNTAHTTNLVPFIFINKTVAKSHFKLSLQGLSDIAPFILKNMNLSVPQEMVHKK